MKSKSLDRNPFKINTNIQTARVGPYCTSHFQPIEGQKSVLMVLDLGGNFSKIESAAEVVPQQPESGHGQFRD